MEEHQSSAPNNPKFNFTLEKRNLSTVHLNAITRIYGEHGPEILELLRKNPAGTIPVVLRRLKQKDLEWRKARQELNKQWKETMEKNYDKSFDHRSFYFKQQDKRTYSAKHLVADIKGGSTGLEAGSALNDIAPAGVSLTLHQDLSHLLLRGSALPMTPQLVLSFALQDVTIHGDIYQIFSHIAETNPSIPIYDRERMTACWRDWLRPLFQIPTYLLYPPSNSAASNATNNIDAVPVDPSEAWTPGTTVLTIFGTAKVLSFRAVDSIFEVMLPYGKGYLKNSAIIGAEELSSQALAAVGIQRDPVTGVDKLNGSTFTELAGNNNSTTPAVLSEPSTVFYGTQNSYTFLRVYHTLYTRLASAKELAYEAAMSALDVAAQESAMEDGSYTMKADLEAKSPQLILLQGAQSKYSTYLSQLICLLDGSLELSRYEEAVRQLLGNKAYVLYTMDKVIQQAFKMFQGLTNDDHFNRLIGIFVYQRSIANTTVVASAPVATNSAPVNQPSKKSKSSAKSSSHSSAVATSAAADHHGSLAQAAPGGRRAVNVVHYLNHIKQMTAFGYEDLYRFQVLSLYHMLHPSLTYFLRSY